MERYREIKEFEGNRILCIKSHKTNKGKIEKEKFYLIERVKKHKMFNQDNQFIYTKVVIDLKDFDNKQYRFSDESFFIYFELKTIEEVRKEKISKLIE